MQSRAAGLAVLLAVFGCSVTATGVLAPDLGHAGDLTKLKAHIDGMKGDVAPVPAPEEEEKKESFPSPVAVGRRLLQLPLPLAGVIAGVVAVRTFIVQRAEQMLASELAALAKQSGSKRIAAPSHARTLLARHAAADEVRARRRLLAKVAPLLAQLEQSTALSQLAIRPSEELTAMAEGLATRVDACGALLAEYESLGQPAPPGFRSWSLDQLTTRRAQLLAKGEVLRELIALGAQVGSPRLDWNLPEWSDEQLRAHVESLRAQASETTERKQKAALLGKVEAAFWRRCEEVFEPPMISRDLL